MVSFRPHLAGRQKLKCVFLAAVCVWFAGANLFAVNTHAFLDRWFAAQKNLRSWSADFVQTRTLKTLTQPLRAFGHVDFLMPDEFRWEIGKPARTIAVGSAGEMFVIYPWLKRAERYPLGRHAPKEWRDMMSLLEAGMPHSRREFEAQFDVLSLGETHGVWRLVLQPRSRSARRMMPQLKLGLATNDFSLVSMEMVLIDGSRMRNDFTNAVVNPRLDKSLFEWRAPADYTVTEPLSE